jgi:hypothetical protein
MASEDAVNPDSYFSRACESQQSPEFTMRNINSLLAYENPMLHSAYEFIRAREIFDRVESYKSFLEDIRLYVGWISLSSAATNL